MQIDFKTCPHCGGYGVRDNGRNCTTCGGVGTGGLHGAGGTIGSGEVMYDKATGRRVTLAEFAKYHAAKRAQEAKQGEQP